MAMIRPRRSSKGEKRYQWRVSVAGFAPRYGTCPTKRCAEECARREEESLRSGLRGGDLTVGELLDLYERDYLPRVPRTSAIAVGHLVEWRKLLGGVPLSLLTPERISQAREKLLSTPGRYGIRRSNSTVNRYVGTLSSALSWATRPEQRLADTNAALKLSRLTEPRGRLRWLSRPVDEESSEFERLMVELERSSSAILRDVVLLLLSTACRKSEILGLRRQDVRLQEGGLYLRPEMTKTKRARFVPLDGVGLEIVKRRLAMPRRLDNDHLFPASRGRGHASFPKRAWSSAIRRAGIEDFRPHDLRHTHLSYLGMLGKSLPEIMAAGGHTTASSAMRYVHLSDKHKRDVNAEVIESMGLGS